MTAPDRVGAHELGRFVQCSQQWAWDRQYRPEQLSHRTRLLGWLRAHGVPLGGRAARVAQMYTQGGWQALRWGRWYHRRLARASVSGVRVWWDWWWIAVAVGLMAAYWWR